MAKGETNRPGFANRVHGRNSTHRLAASGRDLVEVSSRPPTCSGFELRGFGEGLDVRGDILEKSVLETE